MYCKFFRSDDTNYLIELRAIVITWFFQVSSGAQNLSVINRFGALVLGVTALDGVFLGLKYYIMEYSDMSWTKHLRSLDIHKILKKYKKWFDELASDIVVKDGDDARNLISVV